MAPSSAGFVRHALLYAMHLSSSYSCVSSLTYVCAFTCVLFKPLSAKFLVEVEQTLSSGERRQRNQLLAEKMHAGEDILVAAVRGVKEELGKLVSEEVLIQPLHQVTVACPHCSKLYAVPAFVCSSILPTWVPSFCASSTATLLLCCCTAAADSSVEGRDQRIRQLPRPDDKILASHHRSAGPRAPRGRTPPIPIQGCLM